MIERLHPRPARPAIADALIERVDQSMEPVLRVTCPETLAHHGEIPLREDTLVVLGCQWCTVWDGAHEFVDHWHGSLGVLRWQTCPFPHCTGGNTRFFDRFEPIRPPRDADPLEPVNLFACARPFEQTPLGPARVY